MDSRLIIGIVVALTTILVIELPVTFSCTGASSSSSNNSISASLKVTTTMYYRCQDPTTKNVYCRANCTGSLTKVAPLAGYFSFDGCNNDKYYHLCYNYKLQSVGPPLCVLDTADCTAANDYKSVSGTTTDNHCTSDIATLTGKHYRCGFGGAIGICRPFEVGCSTVQGETAFPVSEFSTATACQAYTPTLYDLCYDYSTTSPTTGPGSCVTTGSCTGASKAVVMYTGSVDSVCANLITAFQAQETYSVCVPASSDTTINCRPDSVGCASTESFYYGPLATAALCTSFVAKTYLCGPDMTSSSTCSCHVDNVYCPRPTSGGFDYYYLPASSCLANCPTVAPANYKRCTDLVSTTKSCICIVTTQTCPTGFTEAVASETAASCQSGCVGVTP